MDTIVQPNHHTHVNIMENGRLVWKPKSYLEELRKAELPAEEIGGEEVKPEAEKGTPAKKKSGKKASEPAPEAESTDTEII